MVGVVPGMVGVVPSRVGVVPSMLGVATPQGGSGPVPGWQRIRWETPTVPRGSGVSRAGQVVGLDWG